MLDGASQPDVDEHDGGWLAETLGGELARRIAGGEDDLGRILADGIATIAKRYGLVPGQAPSTTVAIVRWAASAVDVLLLGDSVVVVLTRNGQVQQVRDDRLRHVATEQRAQNARARLRSPGRDDWRQLVNAERVQRNRPGGYWIAEATPQAAEHAVRARWSREEVSAILVMTDGASAGVDRYGVLPDWRAAVEVARQDPMTLVDLVHNVEVADPRGTRWPRSKRHDDKAIAVVELDPN